MKRRDLLTKTPAVAAALIVGGTVLPAEGHEGAPEIRKAQGASVRLRRGDEFNFLIRSEQERMEYSLQRAMDGVGGPVVLLGLAGRLMVAMGDGTHRASVRVPESAELGSYRVVWLEGGEPKVLDFEVVMGRGRVERGSVMAGGFKLVSTLRERRGYPITVEAMPLRAYFTVDSYVVYCPYPVGSKGWNAISDRDEDGAVFVDNGEWGAVQVPMYPSKTRRSIYPRFQQKDIGEADLRERALRVYQAGVEHGFDTARGFDTAWKVVHVEYRCPDGVEHTMAALPESWDSTLLLGVMVKGQIS